MLFNRLQWGRLSSSSSDFCSALFRVSVTTKKKTNKTKQKKQKQKNMKKGEEEGRLHGSRLLFRQLKHPKINSKGGICVCLRVKVFHVLLFRILDPWPLTACILWKVTRGERGCMKESVLSVRFAFFKRTETRPRRAWSGSRGRGRRDRRAKYEDWVRDNDLSCSGYPCQSLSGY